MKPPTPQPTPKVARRAKTATLEGFKTFVAAANPRFRWFSHCEALAAVLIRVANGELKRVMVFMPPRHSKSETVSRLFSAYYLSLHPEKFVGLTSYAAELAFTLSRNARDNFAHNGGACKSDASAVKHWETQKGGGLWAAGVGGAITGKGFDLGIVDDPLKNAKEANSETIREAHKEWWNSTFYTRAEPDAAIVIVQTRWHEDDLSGWLLNAEDADDQPERWHIVNMPALKEADAAKFPATCTVEPDARAVGEALCPERYTAERLTKIMRRIGDYFAGALYQQRPVSKTGGFFQPEKMPVLDVAPANLTKARGWDLAASANATADYTAGLLLGAHGAGEHRRYVILDVRRGQWLPDKVRDEIRQAAQLDGYNVKQRLPQDPGQAGKVQAQQLAALLSGYQVKTSPVSGDKATRAAGFAAQVNAGNVSMVKAPWNAALIEELRSFPLGAHDDQVDAGADAFNELAQTSGVTIGVKVLR